MKTILAIELGERSLICTCPTISELGERVSANVQPCIGGTKGVYFASFCNHMMLILCSFNILLLSTECKHVAIIIINNTFYFSKPISIPNHIY